MKKIFVLCAVCCMCLFFCGCGKLITERDMTDPNNMSDIQIRNKLIEINDWISDIWSNNGICDIGCYVYDGTNAYGKNMDIDYNLETINERYSKKEDMEKFINALDDSKYSSIKEKFNKAIEQMDIIIRAINENKPAINTRPSYLENINTLFLNQADFFKEVRKLPYTK